MTDVLCMEARNLGVKIKTNARVQGISTENGSWKIHTEGWSYEGDAVVLGKWLQSVFCLWF